MSKSLGVVIVLFACLPRIASSQAAITGKITGVVSDASGAVVAGAKVTTAGTALMTPRSTLSQSDGSYLFDLLPPGTYSVTIQQAGFRAFSETGVVLRPDLPPR